MEIIDAHAHIYPEKIAAKATDTIGIFYDIKMDMPAGTAEKLVETGTRAGISRYVVHSVATTAHQVRSINEFIKRECEAHPEFIGFITLHQDLSEEEIESEVDFAIANGLKGIKLHPDFQKFNIDDESAERFYRAADGKLPILFHIGDDRYDFSKPHRLAKMAKKYKANVTFLNLLSNEGTMEKFEELNVIDPKHPKHKDFKKVLTNPIFREPFIFINKDLLENNEAKSSNIFLKWFKKNQYIPFSIIAIEVGFFFKINSISNARF